MAAREFARLEAALDDEADLLGIQRLAQILVDRRLRQLPWIAGAGSRQGQDPDDLRPRDPQLGQQTQTIDVMAVLGNHEVDQRVRHEGLGVGDGAGTQHTVAVLVGQQLDHGRPLRATTRGHQHRAALLQASILSICIVR